ncbi:transmembrane epididymal protein [Thalictrum thalictroides]|uniref:Transmembrane epididymal protein n=1 Tax=Thalictrum thalictroides TaxID=46969 RepID=A0A7J6VX49_THATH|nr:transmembrane epididymal protein [Thalictrum thalictroides]
MGSESSSESYFVGMVYITTNERGEPDKKSCTALDKAITFHAGLYIPEMYKDGHGMPSAFVAKMVDALKKIFGRRNLAEIPEKHVTDRVKAVWREWISPPSAARPSICRGPSMKYLDYLETLSGHPDLCKTIITVDEWGVVECKDSENFSFKKVPEDSDITKLVKAGWRRHKNELRKKYITDKDSATVKKSSPSPFVTNEDWDQFVDMCTSSEYKALCARNIANRKNKLAREVNCNCNDELGRTETDTVHHTITKKQKSVECPDTNVFYNMISLTLAVDLYGHIVPGLALIFLGLWHTFNTIIAYYLKGKADFHSRFWYPCNGFSFKLKYLELIVIFSFSIFSMTIQILDFYSVDFSFMLDNIEHATMFLHLAIYASVALVIELTRLQEVSMWFVGILVASVFSQELFLLHFHSTDHVGLEGHYHWLLQVLVLICLVSSVAMTSFPNSVLPAFLLSTSVLFQGCWFINMGFILWIPGFVPKGCMVRLVEDGNDMLGAVTCETEEAFLRARALANLQFSLIVAAIMLLTACLCLTLAGKLITKRQTIEYEQLHRSNADANRIPTDVTSPMEKSVHICMCECTQTS